MGIFGKKTDWSHMSDDDMKKNLEISANDDRFMIDLLEQNFLDLKQFITNPKFKDEQIIDSTGPSQSGDLTIPSIYIVDNKFLVCSRDMAIHGLMLTVVSFGTKMAFCLETYDNPYINYYDSSKNSFYPFLIVDRNSILEYKSQDHQKFKAVKPKSSQQFAKNLGARGFFGAASGFIPSLIVKGVFGAVAKAQDETIEKVGTIFTLSYVNDEKISEVTIACETHYADIFERFLKNHWITSTPIEEKEPTTKEEKRKRKSEMLSVGDKVRFPGWASFKHGHIIKKEADHALIKLITNDGSEKLENVD